MFHFLLLVLFGYNTICCKKKVYDSRGIKGVVQQTFYTKFVLCLINVFEPVDKLSVALIIIVLLELLMLTTCVHANNHSSIIFFIQNNVDFLTGFRED